MEVAIAQGEVYIKMTKQVKEANLETQRISVSWLTNPRMHAAPLPRWLRLLRKELRIVSQAKLAATCSVRKEIDQLGRASKEDILDLLKEFPKEPRLQDYPELKTLLQEETAK